MRPVGALRRPEQTQVALVMGMALRAASLGRAVRRVEPVSLAMREAT